jgi:hypothetical protein
MKMSEDNVKMNLWCVEVVRIGGGVNWLRISSAVSQYRSFERLDNIGRELGSS